MSHDDNCPCQAVEVARIEAGGYTPACGRGTCPDCRCAQPSVSGTGETP